MKRTLTDAQIAIFRHSEIQTLLREQRRAAEAKAEHRTEEASAAEAHQGDSEDEGATAEDTSSNYTSPAVSNEQQPSNRKTRKAQVAKQKGYFKQKIKPDLRKRTWDKVDSGMESLDYDDQDNSAHTASKTSQRRKISYDD